MNSFNYMNGYLLEPYPAGDLRGHHTISFKEKRAVDRIPAVFEFHCFNEEYFGTITNISEKGIYFRSQKLSFPLSLEFDMYIPLKEEIVPVPVRICRVIKTVGYYDGVGVELLKYPDNYLQFINSLRSHSAF